MQALFEGAVWTEDAEEAPAELRQTLQYSSATGKLYVAADDGNIRCAEVRSQLLSGAWAEDPAMAAAATSRAPPAVHTLRPSLELDLTPTAFALSRSGTYAAVAGPTLTDPELTAVFVLDTAACRAAGDACAAAPLDPGLFASRPGLRVLQLTWHPDSDRHVAVLTSDAAWRLYDVQVPGVAEQTFELGGGRGFGRRGLGLGLEAARAPPAPAAFCFGPREGWDRFSVYFLAADGRVRVLCPVAPFRCRYPARVRAQLEAAVADGGLLGADVADNAEAWLQRAFQPVAAPGPGGELVATVPHALDEHSPALAGPLPVASAGGRDAEGAAPWMSGAAAEALLVWRAGPGLTAVATASAGGAVGAHVLAGGAAPLWCDSTPQGVADGPELRAVRCQVDAAPGPPPPPQLLLLDVIHVAAAPAAAGPADGADDEGVGASCTRRLALYADPASPEAMYCVHPGGAAAITLPWLPLLADYVAEQEHGGGGRAAAAAALPPLLPAPAVEELLGGAAAGVVSAVPIGDALCASALVVLQADGAARCLRPYRAAAGHPTDSAGGARQRAADAELAAAEDVRSEIEKTYGELLRGPKGTAAARGGALGGGAAAPDGQRRLVEATAALRSSHVEFAHQAHYELQERLRQLAAELDSQLERAARAAAAADAEEERWRRIAARVQHAAALQDNVSARLRLLAELHWSLPLPASRAEAAFAGEELPALEAAAARVGAEVEALRGRVAAVRRALKPLAAPAPPPPPFPPPQLRKMREVLAEHDRAIRAARRQAEVIDEALSAAAGI